ncbi:hypothetical protein JAAARDRAFT_172343 [Jaapia argillacea MUCL 33604]|uniref:F-box domain-containing protein n=1 Tax=Jaapia argillacea MUCL 33604 TaxID=933084 RepID=A0A067Q6X9_9AGAM|nr:hypothetical protein JAAARDRAFT_172343 [Jaapia argillacea MUCL 33604]
MTRNSAICLTALPIDILLHILSYLSVKDILRLRQTSTSFLSLTRLHPVWFDAFHTHVRDANIPVPGFSSSSRSSDITHLPQTSLELLTIRALRLRKNWLSPCPTPVRRSEISPIPLEYETIEIDGERGDRDRLRNVVVRFLPGRGNRYLLTVTAHTNFIRRRFTVQCWDLSSPASQSVEKRKFKCVAVRRFTEVVSVAVNMDPSDAAVFCITCKVEGADTTHVATFIHSLDLDSPTQHPEYAFKYMNHFPGCRRALVFKGNLLVGSTENESVRVWDVRKGEVIYELRDPNIHQQLVCLNAMFLPSPTSDCLLLFWNKSIELYKIPSSPPSHSESSGQPREHDLPPFGLPPPHLPPHVPHRVPHHSLPPIAPYVPPPPQSTVRIPTLHPIATYQWQWRIDSISVSIPNHGQHHGDSSRTPPLSPIHLFMRFDSWYPWPVNLLHHFILPPNPAYTSSATASTSPGLMESPYLTSPPIAVKSISSTVRLFAPSDMVVGEWGTAVWLDTQTDGMGGDGELGQRIAGRLLSPQVTSEPEPIATNLDTSGVASNGLDAIGAFVMDGIVPPPVQEDRNIVVDADTDREASMVFGFRDQGAGEDPEDEWAHLAVDEVNGRIVVGRDGGRIEVWEYE